MWRNDRPMTQRAIICTEYRCSRIFDFWKNHAGVSGPSLYMYKFTFTPPVRVNLSVLFSKNASTTESQTINIVHARRRLARACRFTRGHIFPKRVALRNVTSTAVGPITLRMQIRRVDLVQHSAGASAAARDGRAEVAKTKITHGWSVCPADLIRVQCVAKVSERVSN